VDRPGGRRRPGRRGGAYLAYLTDIERSPNTVRAYAHDLKDYWEFLACRVLDWREVRLEDIGEFVAWLRLPPPGRARALAVLPSAEAHVAASTVNRKLSALAAFYQHQARHGVDVDEPLADDHAVAPDKGTDRLIPAQNAVAHIRQIWPTPAATVSS
jgi:site-specific recombinase XerD